MKTLLLVLAACVLAGCCGAQGVPKANLYWPITLGWEQTTPVQVQTVQVPMAPTVQYVPQAVQAPAYTPALAPCK